MPPKGKAVFNAFAALDSDDDAEDTVTFHEPTPAVPVVRLQKKKPQKAKAKEDKSSSSSASSSSSSGGSSSSSSSGNGKIEKPKKLTCSQQVQQIVQQAIETTTINTIVLQYLNMPRGACAYPIMFGSSGDYSAQLGTSWNAELTLLSDVECMYVYKSVSGATKKFERTITTEIVRKGSYDVFPGSYFVFNWKTETHTKGEYEGHQEITEKECNLSWKLEISVTARPPANLPKARPPSQPVSNPFSTSPTSIWKEEPEREPVREQRRSKQGLKKYEQERLAKEARKMQEALDREEERKKAAKVREEKEKLREEFREELKWKFEMRCPLYDSETNIRLCLPLS